MVNNKLIWNKINNGEKITCKDLGLLSSVAKCNFCTKSQPDGKCSWSIHSFREDDCEKAIRRMTKALKKSY